ncbi:peptide ABC transporter [Corynebacterium jeikeium]|uniref:Conserved ABC-type dipeptide transport system n=1 Tax=Corynebacterium jeikeium (strain K411) TaxID=306537 RepID=Q4JVE3_CORJK|nr:conserved ABC-type dipeptide transport system [Corynebacterium jeikeium K411]SUY85430.1 peptide ABC transporter [Corynebacterium jeikeium]
MNRKRHAVRSTAALTLSTVLAAVGLAGCSEDSPLSSTPEQFGYVLTSDLVTSNAGTAVGVATDAAKISARLYPGAFIAGPRGQNLPNGDLVTAKPAPANPRQVDYTINEDATYSDSKPVVCDDFLLSFQASSRPDLFGSDLPLFGQVEKIDCAAGSKTFTVHFADKRGERYRELFGPGTVLPTHTVAEKAGVDDVVSAIDGMDEQALTDLGKAWQDVFTFAKTDPSQVPTSGPYKIAERQDDGSLKLEKNPEWNGVEPAQSPIYLWPQGADVKKLGEHNQLSVVDTNRGAGESPGKVAKELGLNADDFRVVESNSERVDTLRISDLGPLQDPVSRKALNACIDRQGLAKAVEEETGAAVQPVGLRVVGSEHPLRSYLDDINGRNTRVNVEDTRSQLNGMTIRIGFLESMPRYKKIVDTLKSQCAKAGVNIEPVPRKADNYGMLGVDYDVALDTRSANGRNSAVNSTPSSDLKEIRAAETALADDAMTLPLVTEARTILAEVHAANVLDSSSDTGVSWNMDRWVESDEPVATGRASDEGNDGAEGTEASESPVAPAENEPGKPNN